MPGTSQKYKDGSFGKGLKISKFDCRILVTAASDTRSFRQNRNLDVMKPNQELSDLTQKFC